MSNVRIDNVSFCYLFYFCIYLLFNKQTKNNVKGKVQKTHGSTYISLTSN